MNEHLTFIKAINSKDLDSEITFNVNDISSIINRNNKVEICIKNKDSFFNIEVNDCNDTTVFKAIHKVRMSAERKSSNFAVIELKSLSIVSY